MRDIKPSYGLRIRLHTSGSTINSEEFNLEFEFQGKTISLHSQNHEALKVAATLIFETGEFDSKEAVV